MKKIVSPLIKHQKDESGVPEFQTLRLFAILAVLTVFFVLIMGGVQRIQQAKSGTEVLPTTSEAVVSP